MYDALFTIASITIIQSDYQYEVFDVECWINTHIQQQKQADTSIKIKRYSSCRYNKRQLIDVTVVRRVRPRAERSCTNE